MRQVRIDSRVKGTPFDFKELERDVALNESPPFWIKLTPKSRLGSGSFKLAAILLRINDSIVDVCLFMEGRWFAKVCNAEEKCSVLLLR